MIIKSFLALVVFSVSLSLFAKSKEAEAIDLYQQGLKAFKRGDLVLAEKITREAISIVPSDGPLIAEKILQFDYVAKGRKFEIEPTVKGVKEDYKPNNLLWQIERQRAQNKLAKADREKRSAPPKLEIISTKFVDEDNNRQLSAGETMQMSIELINSGKHIAEDVYLILDSSDLQDPNPLQKIRLHDVQPSQRIVKTLVIEAGIDIKSSRADVIVSAKEKDELGEIDAQAFSVATKPFFEPRLKIEYLSNKSDLLVANIVSTHFYRITNIGKVTAFDLKLDLNYRDFDKLKVVKRPNLSNLKHLKEGESTEFFIEVLPSKNAIEGESLGLVFDAFTRTSNLKSIDANLRLVSSSKNRANSFDYNIMSQIANFKHSDGALADNTTGAIILALPSKKTKQSNNASFIKKTFTNTLGIKQEFVLEAPIKEFANTVSAIKTHIAMHNLQHIIFYVDGEALYDLHEQKHYLSFGKSLHSLDQLINAVKDIKTATVTFLLETNSLTAQGGNDDISFKSGTEETIHSDWFSERRLYISQPIIDVNSVPSNTNLLAATQATQDTTSITQFQVGAFTFAIAEVLNELAMNSFKGSQKDLIKHRFEHIQTRTKELSMHTRGRVQTPWMM